MPSGAAAEPGPPPEDPLDPYLSARAGADLLAELGSPRSDQAILGWRRNGLAENAVRGPCVIVPADVWDRKRARGTYTFRRSAILEAAELDPNLAIDRPQSQSLPIPSPAVATPGPSGRAPVLDDDLLRQIKQLIEERDDLQKRLALARRTATTLSRQNQELNQRIQDFLAD